MAPPIRLASPSAPLDQRVQAIETELRRVADFAFGSYQITPNQRGATAGQILGTAGSSFDAHGLVGVLAQPVSSIHGGNPGKVYTGITTPTLLQDGNGVNDALSVVSSRSGQQWLLLGDVQVVGPTAGAQTFGCQIYVDGLLPGDAPNFIWNGGATNAAISLTVFYVATLTGPPASHKFDVRLTTGVATTYTVTAFDLYAFRLGN